MTLDPKRMKRLIRVRHAQEASARGIWIEAQSVADRRLAHADRLSDAHSDARKHLSDQLASAPVRGAVIERDTQLIDGLSTAAGQQRRLATTAQTQADIARKPYDERRRELRSLERLQERMVAQASRDKTEKENAAQDETASQRHHETTSQENSP